jgi:hypothetical protein
VVIALDLLEHFPDSEAVNKALRHQLEEASLGGMLAIVGLLVSTIDFCIPSLIYGAIFGRPTALRNDNA